MDEAGSAAARSRPRLLAVLGISSAVFVAEIVTGLLSNSLALLADAAHVFTDVTGVALALAAIGLAGRPATRRRSYGYYRLEIFAAVVNALLLLAIGAAVLFGAAQRMMAEPEILTGPMLLVAAIGLGANLTSAGLLRGPGQTSMNMRGAYLEVLADALGSVAVLAAGAVIALTGFRPADAIASILIGLLIVPRTWALLRDALDVLLEATPKDVEVEHVRRHILETEGVTALHDLHVWTITSGMNVISAHVVVRVDTDQARVLRDLRQCLSDDFDIDHSTFQLETPGHERAESGTHE